MCNFYYASFPFRCRSILQDVANSFINKPKLTYSTLGLSSLVPVETLKKTHNMYKRLCIPTRECSIVPVTVRWRTWQGKSKPKLFSCSAVVTWTHIICQDLMGGSVWNAQRICFLNRFKEFLNKKKDDIVGKIVKWFDVLKTDETLLRKGNNGVLRNTALPFTDAVKFYSIVIILYWNVIIHSVIFILQREITFLNNTKSLNNSQHVLFLALRRFSNMWRNPQTFSGQRKKKKEEPSAPQACDDNIYILIWKRLSLYPSKSWKEFFN